MGYTLPKSLTKRVKMQSARFYGTVNDLATLTGYSGFDPEVNARRFNPLTPGVDFAAYPRARTYVVGVIVLNSDPEFAMKINHFYTRLLSATLVCLSVTGCRDYLDIQPILEFDNGGVFSNVSNATLAVQGAYDLLSGDNTYGIRVCLYYPMDSDEMMVSGSLDNGRRGIGKYNTMDGNTEIVRPWNDLVWASNR